MGKENGDIVDALDRLSKGFGSEIGEMRGEFTGLKSYIEKRTNNCSNNYDSLTKQMGKLARKINGVVIEKEVEERVTGKFKRILYNRVTLLCTIVGLAIAFGGLQSNNNSKADKKLMKIAKEIRLLKLDKKIVKDTTNGN